MFPFFFNKSLTSHPSPPPLPAPLPSAHVTQWSPVSRYFLMRQLTVNDTYHSMTCRWQRIRTMNLNWTSKLTWNVFHQYDRKKSRLGGKFICSVFTFESSAKRKFYMAADLLVFIALKSLLGRCEVSSLPPPHVELVCIEKGCLLGSFKEIAHRITQQWIKFSDEWSIGVSQYLIAIILIQQLYRNEISHQLVEWPSFRLRVVSLTASSQ